MLTALLAWGTLEETIAPPRLMALGVAVVGATLAQKRGGISSG